MNRDSCSTLVSIVQKLPSSLKDSAGENITALELSQLPLNAMENIARDGRELVCVLGDHLENLQESLMEFLNRELAEAGLSLTERMHLYLSPEGEIVVEDEEKESEILCKIISSNPIFRQRFQELSRLALLTLGIETACKAYDALQENITADPALFSRYHLCFKGALSHFFIK